MATNGSCFFNPDDSIKSPYKYYYPNGSIMQSGYLTQVPGYTDPICIYETSACLTTTCCETAGKTPTSMTLGPLLSYFSAYFFIMFCMVGCGIYQRRGKSKEELEAMKKKRKENNKHTDMLHGMPKWQKKLMFLFYMCAIVAFVIEATVMPKSIQQTLVPSDKVAQMAIGAFLTPVAEIFQFLEDTMVVKVGYAISAGRYEDLNILLHVSTLGGFLCAFIAFLLMIFVAFYEPSAEFVLNPSSKSTQALIDGGCDMIPTTQELLSHARIYWLLISAGWIPNFSIRGLSGFFIGSKQLIGFLLPMLLQGSIPIALWFLLKDVAKNPDNSLSPLTVLGLSYSAVDWILMLFFLTFLACKSSLRKQYKLYCLCCRSKKRKSSTANLMRVGKDVVIEGLELMMVDLAVQASLTVTVYVAADEHFEKAYKIAAADAAYWTFGPQFVVWIYWFLKLMGAQIIAARKYKIFIGMYVMAGILQLSVCIGAIVTAHLVHDAVSAEYGQSACVYATNPHCASGYASIFQGDDSLSKVFDIFGITVALNMCFAYVRAGLATCHDFSFMAKTSCATLLIVYIPMIIIVRLYFNKAYYYYLAMYVPHFVMVGVFGLRMLSNLSKMSKNKPGTWTKHVRRETIVSAGSSSYIDSTYPDGENSINAYASHSKNSLNIYKEALLQKNERVVSSEL